MSRSTHPQKTETKTYTRHYTKDSKETDIIWNHHRQLLPLQSTGQESRGPPWEPNHSHRRRRPTHQIKGPEGFNTRLWPPPSFSPPR